MKRRLLAHYIYKISLYTYTHKETVVNARRLLQYFKLPDKNYIYKETVIRAMWLLQYFKLPDKNYIYIYRRLLAHWDYSNCRTKILAIFRGIFTIFCGISQQLCIYSTISLGIHNAVLWNPKVPRNTVWETLNYTNRPSGFRPCWRTDSVDKICAKLDMYFPCVCWCVVWQICGGYCCFGRTYCLRFQCATAK